MTSSCIDMRSRPRRIEAPGDLERPEAELLAPARATQHHAMSAPRTGRLSRWSSHRLGEVKESKREASHGEERSVCGAVGDPGRARLSSPPRPSARAWSHLDLMVREARTSWRCSSKDPASCPDEPVGQQRGSGWNSLSQLESRSASHLSRRARRVAALHTSRSSGEPCEPRLGALWGTLRALVGRSSEIVCTAQRLAGGIQQKNRAAVHPARPCRRRRRCRSASPSRRPSPRHASSHEARWRGHPRSEFLERRLVDSTVLVRCES